MKKNIANILTASRIAGGVALFFLAPFSLPFFIVYVYCGITDFIDGPIARKTGSTSVLGAQLDTAGDIMMNAAVIIAILKEGSLPHWAILWLLISGIVYVLSAVVAKIRFNKFCFIHTMFGKSLGWIAFITPFVYRYVDEVYVIIVCTVVMWAAVETLLIQLFSNELDVDRKFLILFGKEN